MVFVFVMPPGRHCRDMQLLLIQQLELGDHGKSDKVAAQYQSAQRPTSSQSLLYTDCIHEMLRQQSYLRAMFHSLVYFNWEFAATRADFGSGGFWSLKWLLVSVHYFWTECQVVPIETCSPSSSSRRAWNCPLTLSHRTKSSSRYWEQTLPSDKCMWRRSQCLYRFIYKEVSREKAQESKYRLSGTI